MNLHTVITEFLYLFILVQEAANKIIKDLKTEFDALKEEKRELFLS